MRRNCDPAVGTAPSCDDLCGVGSAFASELADKFQPLGGYDCDAALWLMMDHPVLAPNPGPGQSDAGTMNLVTISFPTAGCGVTDCSVNYCCCVGFTQIT